MDLRDSLNFFDTAGQSVLEQNWQQDFNSSPTVHFPRVHIDHFDADLIDIHSINCKNWLILMELLCLRLWEHCEQLCGPIPWCRRRRGRVYSTADWFYRGPSLECVRATDPTGPNTKTRDSATDSTSDCWWDRRGSARSRGRSFSSVPSPGLPRWTTWIAGCADSGRIDTYQSIAFGFNSFHILKE